MSTKPRATIDNLYQVPDNGKAEIVNGELVVMEPTGFLPSRAAAAIFESLREYERRTGRGFAIPDNAGFVVDLPHRSSFSPDAAFYVGEPSGMKFLRGAPIFAVEVRSESDYGPAAEKQIEHKRADYFAAGTLVVWDVDLLSEQVIRAYTASDATISSSFCRGEIADAEPALPGWRMPVDALFS
jgi:Uma2 family endonuclease